jgi:hypothetical protein
VTKLRVWTTVSVTVSALILIGFLWVMHLAMEEYICFDRSPWWGPPEDPTSECSGLWYSDKHPGEFPWPLALLLGGD